MIQINSMAGKRILFILLSTFLFVGAQAQNGLGTLVGQVKDDVTGEPIFGTNVLLYQAGQMKGGKATDF